MTATPATSPLLACFQLGPASKRCDDPDQLDAAAPAWLHLDRNAVGTADWLEGRLGLPAFLREALMDEETRPRVAAYDGGTLVILRGVNLSPGAKPEDMVSIRLWVEDRRVVSVVLRSLKAVATLERQYDSGRGPQTPSALVAELSEQLTENAAPIVSRMDERLDEIEVEIEAGREKEVRGELLELRHRAMSLRRFVAPQRDALSRLVGTPPAWLVIEDQRKLQETADEVTRLVEHLNFVWERAAMLQEQALARSAEQSNRRLYMLSIIAGIFLPLSFVTGLLGINVAGIPGGSNPAGFLLVCLLLLVVGLLEYLIFRRLRWL